MPGVITCGLGEGVVLGLVALLAGARFARTGVLFFLVAVFGFAFGLLAGFILDMSCPSCCGKTLTLTANTRASALAMRSATKELLGRFMVPPYLASPKRTLTGS